MKSKKFLLDYAERVYSMEVERHNSLITQSGRMVSIQGLFVTILGFLISQPTLINQAIPIKNNVILLLVLISFTLSVLVQIRLPKRYLPTIQNVKDGFAKSSNPEEIIDDIVYEFYTTNIEKMNRTLLKANMYRSIMMTLSTFVFSISVVLMTINILNLI